MAKSKTDLSLVTINQLSALTGCTHRTIKKRLSSCEPAKEDGKGVWYDPKIVLPFVYEIEKLKQNSKVMTDVMPLEIERARLTKWQAEKARLDYLEKDKQLIPVDEIEQTWGAVLSNLRSKILNLPGRIAVAVAGKNDPQEIAIVCQEIVDEALIEIAETEVD